MRALPAGLLNLEQLLRQFLISKETLSVRMLDDSQDPTPLLKEIRDDKTATIIVDANATMSHIILERVSGASHDDSVIHAPTARPHPVSPESFKDGSQYLDCGGKRRELKHLTKKRKTDFKMPMARTVQG